MAGGDMAGHDERPALFSLADEGWSVRVSERRLVFVNGASAIDVPVDGGLRWARDGEDIAFDDVIAAVPAGMHGWLSLAALIALRHSLAGQILAVALPPGYVDWRRLRERAAPLAGWMDGLARLDGAALPAIPDQIDDGLSDELDETVRGAQPG
jgi:hypothetical protein